MESVNLICWTIKPFYVSSRKVTEWKLFLKNTFLEVVYCDDWSQEWWEITWEATAGIQLWDDKSLKWDTGSRNREIEKKELSVKALTRKNDAWHYMEQWNIDQTSVQRKDEK